MLRKSFDGEDILGLKVSGGQSLPNGRIGAVIDKVKRGSIADRDGHIKPGKLTQILKFSHTQKTRDILSFMQNKNNLNYDQKKKSKNQKPKPTNKPILGDEIIEWNGHALHNKSADEVYEIISESRHDPLVDLIVARTIGINRIAAQTSWRQSHSPTRLIGKGIADKYREFTISTKYI